MSMNNLPEDVTVEILLRLPVKSLVRFRCVSKRWRSLISDPQFAKSHFKQASSHTQRLLLSTPLVFGSLQIDAPFGDGSDVKELVFPFKQPGLRVSILGSCNGLVCVGLDDHKDFYIWNPSTGYHWKLPDPEISPDGETYKHGFGYDSSTDDYKVLVASYPIWTPSPFRGAEGKVFSLKRNSWERIQDLDNPYDSNESTGILSNGALHWQVDLIEPFIIQTIIAFDLAEEKFRKVPIPDVYDDYYEEFYFFSLRNLGGRLCFTCYRPTHIEIWGMMEYGVQESWAKMFRLERFDTGYDLVPLCFSRGDQLLALNSGKELIRSDPEGEILERFMVCSDPACCEAAVFVDSLLSPNDYDGQRLLSDEEQR